MSDPKAIADELRSWSDTYWPREKRNDINPGFGNFGDNHTLARILDRAADAIEALVKERDSARAALQATDDYRVADWLKLEEERDRAEQKCDALVREMHARELHHFEVAQDRDALVAVVEKVRGVYNIRRRTKQVASGPWSPIPEGEPE